MIIGLFTFVVLLICDVDWKWAATIGVTVALVAAT